jgi:putative serine protease PepD
MHEAPPDPGSASAATRRGRGGSCLASLATGVIGGLIGAVATAAVLAAVWQPFSGTDVEPPAGPATQTPQPGITIDVPDTDLSFAEAVAVKAMPSVVSVAIEQSAYDPFTGRTATQVVGNGSGVIIRENGYIVTNDHVVAGADAISVTIGVDTLPATIVGRDPSSDLAVLKVDRTGLPAIEIGSSADLRVGQPVVAIGSPFGLDQSLTTGVISALGRTSYMESAEAQLTAYTSLIQTDAAINPGNSGGALTDAEGQLIGINTLIQTGSEYVAQSAGVGFAIPIDYAITITDDLIETGRAEHPYLGVSSLTISEQVATWYELPVDSGVLVDSVAPDSPAERAGIQAGDIIVGIGDDDVSSVEDMFIAIRSHRIGDEVPVRIVRGDETLTVDVTLGSDAER